MKKIAFLFLCLLLSVGLISCGDNKTSSEEKPTENSSKEESSQLNSIVISKESDLETFIDLLVYKNCDYECEYSYCNKEKNDEIRIISKILYDGQITYEDGITYATNQEDKPYKNYLVEKGDRDFIYFYNSEDDKWEMSDVTHTPEDNFLILEKNITKEDVKNNFTEISKGKYKAIDINSEKYPYIDIDYDEYIITVSEDCKSASVHASLKGENSSFKYETTYEVNIKLKNKVEFEYPEIFK